MKDRLIEIDFFKGISILAVILIHMSSSCIKGNQILPGMLNEFIVMNILSRFAVPGFIIVSGTLLFLKKESKFCGKTFIVNKLKYIVAPYIIWSIIYEFFWANLNHTDISLWKHMLFGTSSYHLYYVIVTIQFLVIFLIFRRAINKITISPFLLAIMLIMQLMVNEFLVRNQTEIFGYHFVSTFLPWTFVFLFGIYLGKNYNSVRNNTKKNRVYLVVGVISLVLYQVGRFYMIMYNLKKRPTQIADGIMILLPIFTLLAVISFADEIYKHSKNDIIKNIIYMGRNSYSIFLIHPIFVAIVRLGFANFTQSQNQIMVYLQVVIIILLSVGSIKLIKITPISKYLVGV